MMNKQTKPKKKRKTAEPKKQKPEKTATSRTTGPQPRSARRRAGRFPARPQAATRICPRLDFAGAEWLWFQVVTDSGQ
jgi:hypothetical protein